MSKNINLISLLLTDIREKTNFVSHMNRLEFDSLSFAYRDCEIFDNASVSFPPHKLSLLKGLNGSGKSTAIKLLFGVETPCRGKIVNEYDIIGFSSADSTDLNPYQTVRSFIEDCMPMDDILFAHLLGSLDLRMRTKKRIGELSSGQKKKLSLFRAFFKAGQCIVLDEPITHLDPESQNDLVRVVEHYKNCGMTIVISTHFDAFDSLADDIYSIEDKNIRKLK